MKPPSSMLGIRWFVTTRLENARARIRCDFPSRFNVEEPSFPRLAWQWSRSSFDSVITPSCRFLHKRTRIASCDRARVRKTPYQRQASLHKANDQTLQVFNRFSLTKIYKHGSWPN